MNKVYLCSKLLKIRELRVIENSQHGMEMKRDSMKF